MFSVSPTEMVTIAIVALLVFGPQRLPEIARKLGKIGREVSRAAQELKTGIEREYDEATKPLQDVRRQLGATIEDAKSSKDTSFKDRASKGDSKAKAPQDAGSGEHSTGSADKTLHPPTTPASDSPAAASTQDPTPDRAEAPKSTTQDGDEDEG